MQDVSREHLMIAPLGSGSKGNSTYVGTRQRGVLIDAGLSAKQVFLRLEMAGLGDAVIEGVFVGHEHSDHIGAARVLQRKLRKREGSAANCWMTRGTYEGAHPRCRPEEVDWLEAGEAVSTGSFLVTGIPSPHDTVDPVVFVVAYGGLRAAVLTDMGRSTNMIEDALRGVDVALVEFNHDRDMLLDGHYAWALKQRVLGPQGHLSNDQAGELVERGSSARLQHLVLAHLSADNNTPTSARQAAEAALRRAGNAHVSVHVAPQDTPLLPPPVVYAQQRPTDQPAPARQPHKGSLEDEDPQISLFA